MTDLTIGYYEQNAAELSRRYETTALDTFHRLLQQTCRPVPDCSKSVVAQAVMRPEPLLPALRLLPLMAPETC